MAEFSIFSPYEDRSKDSSEENLDDSLDDGGTVPDSGVSEAGSQMSEDVPSEASTISVSDEIRLARPSKWMRSFLPLMNALFENSPGNANLQAFIFSRVSNILLIIATLP